jgi:hypothetical protein
VYNVFVQSDAPVDPFLVFRRGVPTLITSANESGANRFTWGRCLASSGIRPIPGPRLFVDRGEKIRLETPRGVLGKKSVGLVTDRADVSHGVSTSGDYHTNNSRMDWEDAIARNGG